MPESCRADPGAVDIDRAIRSEAHNQALLSLAFVCAYVSTYLHGGLGLRVVFVV